MSSQFDLELAGKVAVITGASRVEQVVENMEAMALVGKLDESVMERIETILGNRPEHPQDWRGV